LGGPGSKDLEADPRLGHDDAHLIFGTNAYGPDKFRTARIFFTTKPGPVALTTCPERPPVPYFGTPANPLTTRRGPLAWTPVPATQDAAPAGAIVSAAMDPATGRGDALPLWHIDYANGHLISDGTPLVSRFAAPDDALQPGSAPLLDTGDGRLSEAVSHADPTAGGAEAVWTAQTVAGARGRSVVRWYEILPAANRVRQAGVVRDGDEWLFDGAISPTRSGDAAVLLVTAVGPGATPSLRVLARTRATDLHLLAGQRTVDRSADPAACGIAVCPWAPSAAASPDPLAPGPCGGPRSSRACAPGALGLGHPERLAHRRCSGAHDHAHRPLALRAARRPRARPLLLRRRARRQRHDDLRGDRAPRRPDRHPTRAPAVHGPRA
jgi:hypothetical protein